MARQLTENLGHYIVLDTLSFEEKAIWWFDKLLLRQDTVDDMTGFDNGIMMCTPMEYYRMETEKMPIYFMRGTVEEVWRDDIFEVMRMTAEDWTV